MLPIFSHNSCEILQPKHFLFWSYGWKCDLIMVTIISLTQKRIAAQKYKITCKIKTLWPILLKFEIETTLVVINQMKVNTKFWKRGHSSFKRKLKKKSGQGHGQNSNVRVDQVLFVVLSERLYGTRIHEVFRKWVPENGTIWSNAHG